VPSILRGVGALTASPRIDSATVLSIMLETLGRGAAAKVAFASEINNGATARRAFPVIPPFPFARPAQSWRPGQAPARVQLQAKSFFPGKFRGRSGRFGRSPSRFPQRDRNRFSG